MKNYTFTINGNQYEVDVHEIEGNKAQIEVNGTTYSVELHQEVPKAKVIQPAAAPRAAVKESSSAAPVSRSNGASTAVKAPLPGVILQVLVRPGDEVKTGQTLCTLETMKMENAIKSDISGKVATVKIAPGQSVLQDEVLIEIN